MSLRVPDSSWRSSHSRECAVYEGSSVMIELRDVVGPKEVKLVGCNYVIGINYRVGTSGGIQKDKVVHAIPRQRCLRGEGAANGVP